LWEKPEKKGKRRKTPNEGKTKFGQTCWAGLFIGKNEFRGPGMGGKAEKILENRGRGGDLKETKKKKNVLPQGKKSAPLSGQITVAGRERA